MKKICHFKIKDLEKNSRKSIFYYCIFELCKC